MAVFASAANPCIAHPLAGMSSGMGIWLIILSIISPYCGGLTAATLSGTQDFHLGMYHGPTAFGFSVFTWIVVTFLMLGSTMSLTATTPQSAAPTTVASVVATAGYWLFFALLLGMIAAAIGGSHGAPRKPHIPREDTQEETGMRRVA
jgi:cytochrome b561